MSELYAVSVLGIFRRGQDIDHRVIVFVADDGHAAEHRALYLARTEIYPHADKVSVAVCAVSVAVAELQRR